MFATLISKISTTLSAVTQIQKVYSYPTVDVEGYPAAIYFPIGDESDYYSTREDFIMYRFKIFLVCETKVKGITLVYNEVMPKLVDAVRSAFRTNWSQGVSTENHRIWWNLANGDWGVFDGDDGQVLVAEYTLNIKVISNT